MGKPGSKASGLTRLTKSPRKRPVPEDPWSMHKSHREPLSPHAHARPWRAHHRELVQSRCSSWADQVEPSSFNVCCWLIIISSTSYAIRNRAIIASIQPRFLSFYLGWTASAIDLLAMATCKADRLRSKHRCDRNNVRMLFC